MTELWTNEDSCGFCDTPKPHHITVRIFRNIMIHIPKNLSAGKN